MAHVGLNWSNLLIITMIVKSVSSDHCNIGEFTGDSLGDSHFIIDTQLTNKVKGKIVQM